MTARFKLLLSGLLPVWIREVLIVAAIATTALVFYKDFKDFEVPDWIVDVCGIPIIAFWVWLLCPDLNIINIFSVVWVFLLGYSFVRVFLTIVGKASDIGAGDATYAGVLVLLLPSPTLWGSPFHYIPSKFGAMPLDFAINIALVFIIGGIAAKLYAHLRNRPFAVPFTPAVATTFATTVLFGALWRPVVMPMINFVISFV